MQLGTLLTYVPGCSAIFTPREIEYYNRVSPRALALQFINAAYLLIGAYMIWKTVGVVSNTDTPIVVVLSESMHPGFNRGDILLLANWKREVHAGDICVFQLAASEIPIVHRVRDTNWRLGAREKGEMRIMTKGDNNSSCDTFLYRKVGKEYLGRKDIGNFVYASFPLLGMFTIWANSFPGVKYLIMLLLFVEVFFARDDSEGAPRVSVPRRKNEHAAETQPEEDDKKK